MNRCLSKIFIFFSISVFVLLVFAVFVKAQDECQTLKECQDLLEKYEKEISQHEKDISKTQQEQQTLQNKIYILRKKIEKLDVQIKQSNVVIKDLEVQIGDTASSVDKTVLKIQDSREKLAEILRTIYQEDQNDGLEFLLTGDSLSDFFDNIISLESLLIRNQEIVEDIKTLKINLESQKSSLDGEKDEWERMVKMQILQKQESQRTKSEQEWVLSTTKGEEAEYQKLLSESQARAQKIRGRIFELIGVPEAPTFGQALEIAKYVERLTAVRPAFLLAVLTQESNIGKNVGQCYLKNPETGEGIVAKSGQKIERVMKPGRDVPHFLNITKKLGKDPYNTLVSCPMSFGWGGAMGPAQFIPSTWALYGDRISSITGKPANPWDIKDAFLGAGLLLRDAGASSQTFESEWRAAMIYFSGSTNSKYKFYGDSVMAITQQYASDIEDLERFAQK